MNAAFFKLWVPKIRAAAKSIGVSDFPIFGEVTLNDSVDLSTFVRTRGVPQLLDFPFQEVAADYASGSSGSKGVANRLADDDYFLTATGTDPAFTTFLGNHDMGRAAQQILSRAPGLGGNALLQHVELGWDLLYLLRGAPAVQWGDEAGMIGSGGDKAAREDMFLIQVRRRQTEQRVGGPPIGKGSSFTVTNPLQTHLKTLAGLPRRRHPRALDRRGVRAPAAAGRPRRLACRCRHGPGDRGRVQQRRPGREGDGFVPGRRGPAPSGPGRATPSRAGTCRAGR